MKKNSINIDKEIDLVELIKTIWDGKIKIVLITIIIVVITYGYNQQLVKSKKLQEQEKIYKNSLNIKVSNSSKFIKFYRYMII